MAQDLIKKEALFNEVKGSLFEYLVAHDIAVRGKEELIFQQSLDKNYLTVLAQQDRMIRQFYPEMLHFLKNAAVETVTKLIDYFGVLPSGPRVVGKFSNSSISSELHEADLLFNVHGLLKSVSLKLNKKNAFVNTKSGGIKSFFQQYFPFIPLGIQQKFNQLVDMEFNRMAFELHALHDLEYPGNFSLWVKNGFSELPGELDTESREVLKRYYSRIASEMHLIFEKALLENAAEFKMALPALMGFGNQDIIQLIYFHDFPENKTPEIEMHAYPEVIGELDKLILRPFGSVSSLEFELGPWQLQVRVKPMNKFTTTAIKINCSVKTKRPEIS